MPPVSLDCPGSLLPVPGQVLGECIPPEPRHHLGPLPPVPVADVVPKLLLGQVHDDTLLARGWILPSCVDGGAECQSGKPPMKRLPEGFEHRAVGRAAQD